MLIVPVVMFVADVLAPGIDCDGRKSGCMLVVVPTGRGGAWKGCCLFGGGVGSCTTRLGASALLSTAPKVGGRSEMPGLMLVAV